MVLTGEAEERKDENGGSKKNGGDAKKRFEDGVFLSRHGLFRQYSKRQKDAQEGR